MTRRPLNEQASDKPHISPGIRKALANQPEEIREGVLRVAHADVGKRNPRHD